MNLSFLKESYKHILMLLFVSLLVYVLTLNADFVYDDIAITVVENPLLKGEISLLEVFLTWDRPLRELTYLIDHTIWGFNPFGYHLQNLVWHSLNTCLLFLFLLYLVGAVREPPHIRIAKFEGAVREPPLRNLSFAAALLFAVHPINTESVAWISGRKELLCLFFELLACMLFVYSTMNFSVETKQRRIAYWGALLAVILAFLSKQVAVAIPLLLVAACWFYAKQHNQPLKWTPILKALIPFLVLTLLCTLFSYRLIEHLGIVEQRGTFYDPASREVDYTLLSAVLTPFATLYKSLFLCFWPIDLVVERGFLPVVSVYDFRWLSGFIAFLVLILIAYKSYSKLPGITFGILWFMITWLPVSGAVPVGYVLADRYLYIPCVGFCVVIVIGIKWLIEKLHYKLPFALPKGSVLFLIFLIVLFFSTRTVIRTMDWQNELSLWLSAAQSRPQNVKVMFNLANAYRDAGKIDEAFKHWQKALQLNPDYPQVLVSIGNAEKRRGNLKKAENYYSRALELEPEYGLAHYNLALLLKTQNRKELALKHFKLAANFLYSKRSGSRWKGMAYYEIAQLFYEQEKKSQATIYLARAESLAPEYAPIYLLKGMLHLGQPQIARNAFLTAIQLNPSYDEAYYNLGVLEWQTGNHQAAEKYWARATELNPNLKKLIKKVQN